MHNTFNDDINKLETYFGIDKIESWNSIIKKAQKAQKEETFSKEVRLPRKPNKNKLKRIKKSPTVKGISWITQWQKHNRVVRPLDYTE